MEISRSVQNQTIQKDKKFAKKCFRAKCNSPHFGIFKKTFLFFGLDMVKVRAAMHFAARSTFFIFSDENQNSFFKK